MQLVSSCDLKPCETRSSWLNMTDPGQLVSLTHQLVAERKPALEMAVGGLLMWHRVYWLRQIDIVNDGRAL